MWANETRLRQACLGRQITDRRFSAPPCMHKSEGQLGAPWVLVTACNGYADNSMTRGSARKVTIFSCSSVLQGLRIVSRQIHMQYLCTGLA